MTTDLGRRDFFIAIPNEITEETPVSWYEGWKANAQYINMPFIERIEEERIFGGVPVDTTYDVAANISEELLPYYDDLIRAKNEKHLRFLEGRARTAQERRRKAAEAPLTAQLAGGLTDPLALTAFIPGLNYVRLGKTFTQAITRAGGVGGAYGIASELRRAPFAVADEPGETYANVAAATVFSAAFGGVMKGAPYAKPFFQSGAAKVNKLFKGEKFDHMTRSDNLGPLSLVSRVVNKRDKVDDLIDISKNAKAEVSRAAKIKDNAFDKIDEDLDAGRINSTTAKQRKLNSPELAAFNAAKQKLKDADKAVDDQIKLDLQADDDGYTPAKGGDYDPVVSNPLGSPSQRAMQRTDIPDDVKELFMLLSYNGAVSTQGARRGIGIQSVAQESVTYQGQFQNLVRRMRDLHSQEVRGVKRAAQFMQVYNPRSGFDDWANDTIRRYIFSKSRDPQLRRLAADGISDQQKEVGVLIADAFKAFSDDMRYYGVVKDDEKIRALITKNQADLDSVTAKLIKLESDISKMPNKAGTKKQFALQDALDKRQATLKARIEFYEGQIGKVLREDFTFPIFYNKDLLSKDEGARQALAKIFDEEFAAQRLAKGDNEVRGSKKFGTFDLRTDGMKTLSRILEEDGEEMTNILRSKTTEGRAKHLKSRKTNVDVAKVYDYILTDPEVMYTYFDRMGRRISFANKFGGRNIDEVLEDMEDSLRKAGKSNEEISRLKADFYGDYERVMGTLQRSPDRYDNAAVKAAKTWTGWTYLPQAGISAITDPGSIVMAHGFRDVFEAGIAAADGAFRTQVIKEAQAAGELLDITKNVYARELLSDTVRRVKPNMMERFIQRGNQVFYTLNGLAPITFAGKTLDQIIVQDKFIKLSRQWSEGKISLFDREYLARYGIDEDMAKFISTAPTEKSDIKLSKRGGAFEVSNTDDWDISTPQARETLRKYQAAIQSHANNTIVMGQTFDKPLIIDGVVYMKDNPFFQAIRKKYPTQFPIKKIQKILDKYKPFEIESQLRTGAVNMVRVESGLLTTPFTFMNFAFGANNKILGAIRDPNRQHRLQGIVALLGLSYLSLSYKKPDYWFEKRTSPDVIARVVDHSGVFGIYSDLAYTALNIAGNAGVVSKDAFIPPKYINPNEDEALFDAFLEPLGAPAGLTTEYVRAVDDYFSGRESDAAERMKYSLPFIGLPIFGNDVKDFVGELGRN